MYIIDGNKKFEIKIISAAVVIYHDDDFTAIGSLPEVGRVIN